jgi:ribosomal protein L30/L7E
MIVVVRMRGDVSTSRDVIDTFRILGMKRLYSAAILEDNKVNKGMLRKINSFAAWGEASEETVSAIGKLKRLKPPKGGMRSKKLAQPKGVLGYHGDKINDIIKKML